MARIPLRSLLACLACSAVAVGLLDMIVSSRENWVPALVAALDSVPVLAQSFLGSRGLWWPAGVAVLAGTCFVVRWGLGAERMIGKAGMAGFFLGAWAVLATSLLSVAGSSELMGSTSPVAYIFSQTLLLLLMMAITGTIAGGLALLTGGLVYKAARSFSSHPIAQDAQSI